MRIGRLPLAAALLTVCCGGLAPQDPPAEKPNFVVLLADDLGWTDLGCYGSDLYETPHLDRLAADGMRFTHGYAACTVCSPTRAAILTGMYPGRTHVTDFITGGVRPKAKLRIPDWTMQLDHRHTSLAEALGAAGYRTAHVGKWHLMPRNEPDVMMDFTPEKHGFEINIGGNEWGAPGSYFHPYANARRKVTRLPAGGADGDYLTDRLTDEALKILDDFGDAPFFLYFAYYAVHTPLQAKPEEIARFEPKVTQDGRHRNATYAAMIAALDHSVGRLRAKLEELGIAERTTIVFTGDNGGLDRRGPDGRMGHPTENHPLRAGKGSAYEGGVRTPTVYYQPGVTQAGSVSAEPVISADIYPTILEIADVEGAPEHNADVDGVSLAPLLRGGAAKLDREALYWHYPHYHTGGATPHSAVRAGDWRLVEFYEDGRAELYNLKDDVGEERDLAAEMPEKTKELRRKLHDWRAAVGAQDPTPNPDYDPGAE